MDMVLFILITRCSIVIVHQTKALAAPRRPAFLSWLPASCTTEFEISWEILRNFQLSRSPECIYLRYSCIQTYKSDMMQLKYIHIYWVFVIFLVWFPVALKFPASKARRLAGGKASMAPRVFVISFVLYELLKEFSWSWLLISSIWCSSKLWTIALWWAELV